MNHALVGSFGPVVAAMPLAWHSEDDHGIRKKYPAHSCVISHATFTKTKYHNHALMLRGSATEFTKLSRSISFGTFLCALNSPGPLCHQEVRDCLTSQTHRKSSKAICSRYFIHSISSYDIVQHNTAYIYIDQYRNVYIQVVPLQQNW